MFVHLTMQSYLEIKGIIYDPARRDKLAKKPMWS